MIIDTSLHDILDPPGGESVGVFFRLLGPCLPYSIIIICYLLIIRRLKVIIILIIIIIINIIINIITLASPTQSSSSASSDIHLYQYLVLEAPTSSWGSFVLQAI